MVGFEQIFYAKSIAVVGASNNPSKAAHQIISTMLKGGYRGTIYPVHPREKDVLGLKCYQSISEIEESLDLLVIGVPAKEVYKIFLEASIRGDIKGAVILSAGFSETGDPELVELEDKIVQIAKKAGIRIFGPNCIGIINTDINLSTSFAPVSKVVNGNVGFITQSGSFGGSLLMLAEESPKPLGFNKWAHVGNMSDVSNIEILEYFGADPKISSIGMYLEGLAHGKELLRTAKKITRNKPIFLLKVGKTALGSRATLSHTGIIAGSDKVYDAAFKQSGIIRVDDMEELFDSLKASSMLPKPKGNKICVLTEAGGPGIIAIDEITKDNYLQLAPITEHTINKLKKILYPMATICKPNGYIDMTAAALEKEHEGSLRLVLEDSNVDSVVLISLPPTFLPALNVAKSIAEVIKDSDKPVIACFMKGESMLKSRRFLENNNIPTFDTPRRAARALVNLTKASSFLKEI
ncbi:MAG: acetate--CoA ligase family protein [Promethearchaeota archaeon]